MIAAQPPLLEGVDQLACAQLLRGIHAHVQRGVVGVGETPLGTVDLHRGDAEVEVDGIRLEPLCGELLERLAVVAAQEAQRARDLSCELGEAALGGGVAVDRHERALGPEALGHGARVPAAAAGAVDGRLPGPHVECLHELVGKHRRVRRAVRAARRGAGRALALAARRSLPPAHARRWSLRGAGAPAGSAVGGHVKQHDRRSP